MPAQRILAGLGLPAAGPPVSLQLRALLHTRPEITLARRALALMVCSLLLVIMGTVGIFLSVAESQVAGGHRDSLTLWRCLITYESLHERPHEAPLPSHANDAAKRQALGTYMARRFAGFPARLAETDDIFARVMSSPKIKARLQEIIGGHPKVTDEEFQKAKTTLGTMLDKRGELTNPFLNEPGNPMGMQFSLFLAAFAGFVVCTGSLLCAVIFRMGPVLRGLGIDLVRWDGLPASRWRTTWRALIAWGPLAAALPAYGRADTAQA